MKETAPSRAIVDLGAYAQNLQYIKKLIPPDCAMLAVIKADAYGHGAIPVARRALAEGVSMLGVAGVLEGLELREAGIEAPILVMTQPAPDQLAIAVEHGLRMMISDINTTEIIGEIARKSNKVAPVHCKIDSGMGRQGFDIENAVQNLTFLTRISNIDIEGIATHFPVSEIPEDVFTLSQIRIFKHLLKQLDKSGIPYEMAHAANSAAIVNYPSSYFSLVRPGLISYGVWPTVNAPKDLPIRPVLRWETRVVLVKELEQGFSVGYGRTYTTPTKMRVAILPVGYADGYKHGLSNKADVLIQGKRCPVRGSVCMDQIVVDVSALDNVMPGDVATLIGRDGDEMITAEELARHIESIPYDIFTGIGHRVAREYVG